MGKLDESAVREIAQRQFGVFSRQQVLELGLSAAFISWRLDTEQWLPVFETVYRVAGAPESWRQVAFAALLFAGRPSALSHRTAGYLWGFDGPGREPRPIELVVPRKRRVRLPGVIAHRVQGSVPCIERGRFTVTSVARTLVDLAGVLPARELEFALDSAQRRFGKVADWLQAEVARAPRTTHGIGQLKELLAVRTRGATDSALEVSVLRRLRRAGVPVPVQQHEVFDEVGDYVMRLDLCWPDRLVALHVDGYGWHQQRERFERDCSSTSTSKAACRPTHEREREDQRRTASTRRSGRTPNS